MEAMDVLTSAWTGNGAIYPLMPLCQRSSIHFSFIERLLPSHRAVPAPFTREEFQELMTIIRSFGGTYQSPLLTTKTYLYEMTDDHDDHGTQIRIVSRVLLRVGQSILLKAFLPHLQLGSLVLSMFSPLASILLPTQQTSSY